MKKAKSELDDWGRSEYKRSDLGELVRGKYAKRIQKSTNVLDPIRQTNKPASKPKTGLNDRSWPDYKRSDFGKLIRGK